MKYIKNKNELPLLGNRLKELREKHKLTIAELADICDIQASAFCRVEQGLIEPKILTLIKLCDVYKMNMNKLLTIR